MCGPLITEDLGELQVQKSLGILALKGFSLKAGDGTRTHDIQLGKLTFYH